MMPTDVNRINLSVLKSQYTLFHEEKKYFKNESFSTFSSSYFCRCSDFVVKSMASNLEKIYKKIYFGYEKIDDWWNLYNSNAEALERYLSHQGSLGEITDVTIRSCAKSKIFDLDSEEIGGENFSTVSSILSSVDFASSNNAFNLDQISENTNVSSFQNVVSSVSDFFKKAGNTVLDVLKKVEATIVVTATSILKGLLKLVEGLVDAAFLLRGMVLTPATWLVDLVTGGDYHLMDTWWEQTKSIVGTDCTSILYDGFYHTGIGEWLQANSLVDPYGAVCSFISGVGYVTGVVIITVLTGGVGGAATAASSGVSLSSAALAAGVSGLSGFGSNTEEAWNSGASTKKGLAYGAVMGGIEGLGTYFGMKMNNFQFGKFLGKSNSKSINIFGRLILDSADGASIGFTKPLAQMTYAGDIDSDFHNKSLIEQYQWLFDKNGGWTNVGVNAAVGGAFSFLGEFPGLFKKSGSSSNSKSSSNSSTSKSSSSSSSARPFLGDDDTYRHTIQSMDFDELCKTINRFSNDASRLNGIAEIVDSAMLYKLLENRKISYLSGLRDDLKKLIVDNLEVPDTFFRKYSNPFYGANQAAFKNKKSSDYKRLCDKLVNKDGMNIREAKKLLDIIDTVGVCSYASQVNLIFHAFKDDPKKFKEIFGYDMFDDTTGVKNLNFSELLLDLYVFANSNKYQDARYKGNLFEYQNNKLVIKSLDANNQVYCSSSSGANQKLMNEFLKSKKQSLTYSSDNNYCYRGDFKAKLINLLNESSLVNLNVWGKQDNKFHFYMEHDTSIMNDEGHAVFVTGISDNGAVVATWGQKATIPFEDFVNGIYGINAIKIGGIYD